jgi:hypothetical protein
VEIGKIFRESKLNINMYVLDRKGLLRTCTYEAAQKGGKFKKKICKMPI